jgi:hypothetical protein
VLEKRAMAPPTKLEFALYYLVFTIFHHVKNKIIQISPLNCYLISFSPSNNFGQVHGGKYMEAQILVNNFSRTFYAGKYMEAQISLDFKNMAYSMGECVLFILR